MFLDPIYTNHCFVKRLFTQVWNLKVLFIRLYIILYKNGVFSQTQTSQAFSPRKKKKKNFVFECIIFIGVNMYVSV